MYVFIQTYMYICVLYVCNSCLYVYMLTIYIITLFFQSKQKCGSKKFKIFLKDFFSKCSFMFLIKFPNIYSEEHLHKQLFLDLLLLSMMNVLLKLF